MIFYQDKYVTIRRPYGTSSFLRIDWKETTSSLSDFHFKNIINILTDILEEKKIRKILANGTNNFYVMPSDMQDWHENDIIPRYRSLGIARIAFLISTELMIHLDHDTPHHSQNNGEIPAVRFFASEYEAIRWLLE
ncbi:hypothetical protein V6R21_17310 [Limibacter armeniacum]|uniref:hypothetical protein n=1 Tax=Limibacter armeniacum TaxID=466084 RepID=UPI002FE54703